MTGWFAVAELILFGWAAASRSQGGEEAFSPKVYVEFTPEPEPLGVQRQGLKPGEGGEPGGEGRQGAGFV